MLYVVKISNLCERYVLLTSQGSKYHSTMKSSLDTTLHIWANTNLSEHICCRNVHKLFVWIKCPNINFLIYDEDCKYSHILNVMHYSDPSRMYTTRSDASSAVVSRQQSISDTYEQLMKLAKVCRSIRMLRIFIFLCLCQCTYVATT